MAQTAKQRPSARFGILSAEQASSPLSSGVSLEQALASRTRSQASASAKAASGRRSAGTRHLTRSARSCATSASRSAIDGRRIIDRMEKRQGTITAPVHLNIQPHEIAATRSIAAYGMDVEFRERIRGKSVKTPDFLAGGVLWEVKAPTSDKLKVVEKRLRQAIHQSRDIIFDSRRMKRLTNKQIQDEVVKWTRNLHHIRRLLYINRAGEVIKIK